MRVAFLTEIFAKNMGYLENLLPKELARQGLDVHVIATNLPPYYQLEDCRQLFSDLHGGNQESTVEQYNGFTLHILPHRRTLGHIRMVGLGAKLRELRPDIVQTTAAIGWLPLESAFYRLRLGYKLFTGSHNAASGFPLAGRAAPWWDGEKIRCTLTRALPGRLISWQTEKCYSVTKDCAEIAWRFFGVQRGKVEVMHLGVDTDYFYPVRGVAEEQQRAEIRTRLRLQEHDILCIYTGKMTTAKNALLLAQAVAQLRAAGAPYSALLIGEGPQRTAIEQQPHCSVLGFLPYQELAAYYRAADIGVWPANESTSTLDAAACGLPVVISDLVADSSHVEGNGLVFKVNDLEDLVATLLKLRTAAVRKDLGNRGAEKMRRDYSMEAVAARRLHDYEQALSRPMALATSDHA